MKSASDPRHILRRKIVKELYTASYGKVITEDTDFSETTEKILKQINKIDKIIEKAAPEWPITKINKIDLAVLRLSIWEITQKKTPTKATIDEAVELAKEYGSEGSPAFVNGVLGTVYKTL